MKRIMVIILLVAFISSAALCDTFTDIFNNTNYLDVASSTITSTTTSTTSGIDTSNGKISMPFQKFTNIVDTNTAAYLQNSGASTYASVNAITYGAQPLGSAAGYWLIGCTPATTVGSNTGKLLSYDGTSFTQLQADIPPLNAQSVAQIIYANKYFWLLDSNSCFRYANHKRDDYTSSATNFTASAPVNSLFSAGAFSGSNLFFGSSNGAMCVLDTDTTPWTDLSATFVTGTPFWPCFTEPIRSVASNGSYFLVGGGYNNSGATSPGRLWKYNPSASGPAAWTNLCTNNNLSTDLNFNINIVYEIGWNGSAFLIGGNNGQLAITDGTNFTNLSTNFISPAGGNFGGTNTVNAIIWDGYNWIIGGTGGKLVKYDGAGIGLSNFQNISWLLDTNWSTSHVTSSSLGNNYMIVGGSNGNIDGCAGLYATSSEMRVQSKQVNVGSGRVYKATLTATDSQPAGTSIKYYISADNGTNWQQVSSGVEASLAVTGNALKWKAVFSGGMTTPTLSQIAINYLTTDMSIIPAGVGGTVVTSAAASGGTGSANVSIVVPGGSSNVDVQYTIAKDSTSPESSSAIIAFDVNASNYFNGSSISTFNNPLTLIISYNNIGGTYVDNTSSSVPLFAATTSLALAFWNGLNWVPVSSTVTTSAGNVINVSARVTHFSKYAIVAASPSAIQVKAQPNPFTPLSSNSLFNRLTVSFPNPGGSAVVFKVWDVNGVLLKTINDSGSTQVTWDGKDFNSGYVETGLYIYEVKVGGSQTGRGTFAVAR